ncbi:MAG: transglycosylase SLT domain-containing protein [Muribaculaceae bacterium]|nr:transglycosylase SLT domain-containing protein [Muribaculaceae bacterium]
MLKGRKRRVNGIMVMIMAAILCTLLPQCKKNHSHLHNHGNDIDTLKVVTLYGPTSFFLYRGEEMGIDYDNVKKFADDEGMFLELKVLNNISELIEALKTGEADLAAYPVPSISEYKSEVIHCGPQEVTRQVLVQKNNSEKINDVTELIGKEVYVEKASKYHYRLENLNEELGGGIEIRPIDNDTIIEEDLLAMVSHGEIPFTVVDSNIASLYKSAYPDLDISIPISSDQGASWAVANGLDSLAKKIDRWENRSHSSDFIKSIYKGYYDRTYSQVFDNNLSYFKKLNLSKGASVSSYDGLFKNNANLSGYDWRLLAAIAFCESRYNPGVESRFGAKGLMQVMPNTAKAVGIEPASLGNPDQNIKAAAKILKRLDNSLESRVSDPEERIKFVVAAYNAGLGHIYDAIALADKLGLDAGKWTGNVSVAALMKSRPEYYNDPVVRNGYFRGRETVDFVDHVTGIYRYLKENTKA